MIKNNIQLFRKNDEYSRRFYNVIYKVNEIQQAYLLLLKSDYIYSKSFATLIYNNNLFSLSQFFNLDYFVNNFSTLISSLEKAGTFESYIHIIKSALGVIDIIFKIPDPSHLIITIDEKVAFKFFGAKKNAAINKILANETTTTQKNIVFKVQQAENYIASAMQNLIKKTLIPSQTQYPNSQFVFKRSILQITVDQTVKLIELINVNGVFVEIFLKI